MAVVVTTAESATSYVISGFAVDGGNASQNNVPKSPADLVTTRVSFPGDINTTYGTGWLLNNSATTNVALRGNTNAKINALYYTGMQMSIIADLAKFPLYAVSGQFQTDMVNLVSNFSTNAGGVTNNIYITLYDSVENYGASGTQMRLGPPLSGADAPTVGGGTGAWTLTLTYQSSSGSSIAGTQPVLAGDNIYLDEVTGVSFVNPALVIPSASASTTTGYFGRLSGPYQVTTATTVSGVTTFTVSTGSVQPFVLSNSAQTDIPTGLTPVPIGGWIKMDSAVAVARAQAAGFFPGGTSQTYRQALVATFLSVQSAVHTQYNKASVGLGLTGTNWSSANPTWNGATNTIDLSDWASALAASDFTSINLIAPYSSVFAATPLHKQLMWANAQLYGSYPKRFMVSSFDIYDPTNPKYKDQPRYDYYPGRGPVNSLSVYYGNLATAFSAFLSNVFTDGPMRTLTNNGLRAWSWYNDEYLNLTTYGDPAVNPATGVAKGAYSNSYVPLVNATNRYALPTFSASNQNATAQIAAPRAKTQSAAAWIVSGESNIGSATAQISHSESSTQTATAQVSHSESSIQTATAQISHSESSTQTATAQISHSESSTQTATATVLNSVSKVQFGTASIQPVGGAFVTATASIRNTTSTFQTATSKISVSKVNPLSATSRISASVQNPINATAKVAVHVVKQQPATAKIHTLLTVGHQNVGLVVQPALN